MDAPLVLGILALVASVAALAWARRAAIAARDLAEEAAAARRPAPPPAPPPPPPPPIPAPGTDPSVLLRLEALERRSADAEGRGPAAPPPSAPPPVPPSGPSATGPGRAPAAASRARAFP